MKTLIGQTQGGLTCIAVTHKTLPNGKTRNDPVCRCLCGIVVQLHYTSFHSGKAYRCGKKCTVVPKRASKPYSKPTPTGRGRTTHPLYVTYQNMLRRCSPGNDGSEHYYDRGIRVCPQWATDFWTFVADVGERPEGKTLDRKDNNGHYEPSNVQWSDSATQANNRRPSSEWIKHKPFPEFDDTDIIKQ